MTSPASVGLSATRAPASARASIFAWAVPLLPEMMAPAWPIAGPGRGYAGDVRDDGLVHVFCDVSRRLFLFNAANLADKHDRFGLRVGLESAQAVDERRTRDGVATDTHARRNADSHLFQFVQRLVSKGAAAADDAHRATGESDLARRNADIAFAGTDDPGAVGADQAGRWVSGDVARCKHAPRPGPGSTR